MRGIAIVERLERYALDHGKTLASLDLATLQAFIAGLIADGSNTTENLDALIHHMATTGNTALYLYLDGLVAGREVLPSIARRLAEIAGAPACEQVFRGFALPPLGSHQRTLPPVTQDILTRLRSAVGGDTAKKVLAGNHHGVPGEGFAPLRQVYLENGIDAALAERHRRLVGTLERHLASAKPWFEQVVTQAFVDHVRSNQEVGAGVRDGGRIYFCKVPYAPQDYFDAQDPTLKRYYMCHCPLAREAIIDRALTVDPMLCYCGAGFTKVAFDVIFGQSVEVDVLESALAGDTRCRFSIVVPPRE